MQPQDIITSLDTLCDTNDIPRFVFDRKRMIRLHRICAKPQFNLYRVKINWSGFEPLSGGSFLSEKRLNYKFPEIANQIIPANAIPFILNATSKKIALCFTYEQVVFGLPKTRYDTSLFLYNG